MAGSTTPASQVPLYGRAWELVVTLPNGPAVTVTCSSWEPEALRMAFDVSIKGYSSHSAFWYARIDIYNLAPSLAHQLLGGQGATVKLSAGYQVAGRYGVIFEGEVYQTKFERIEVTDAKVTLMCYTGLAETIANFVTMRGDPQMTQVALIQKMCAAANTPITIAGIDTSAIQPTQLPRARPVFGNPHKFIDEVAAANSLVSWYGFDGLSVTPLDAAQDIPAITYDGSSGQIKGTPQQTQDGIDVNVMLDPRIRVAQPPQLIELTNTQIAQLSYQPPGYRPYLDPSGKYLVNGVQHIGDTKGEDWTSAIVAYTSIGGKAAFLLDASQNPVDPRSAR